MFEELKQALKEKADQNKDGKLTKKDVELIVNRVAAVTVDETRSHPFGMLITTAVIAFVLGMAFCRFTS